MRGVVMCAREGVHLLFCVFFRHHRIFPFAVVWASLVQLYSGGREVGTDFPFKTSHVCD